MVSEYIPRGNLLDFGYQRFGEKMPVKTACQLVAQASEGLEWFHGKGYVHRDIKPENILVGKTGDGYVAKLADFGLAKNYLLHGGTITGANEWSGTILFCPPEQILDFKSARPCNDIYAMGMTLYSLISGEFPYDFPGKKKNLVQFFAGRKPRDPISFILGDDKPEPIEKKVPEIDRRIAKVINGAIEKDSKKRIASVQEFIKGLK